MIQNLSKNEIMRRFNEGFLELNENEKESFSNACNKLLSNNFIYGQSEYDDKIYYVINRFKELIEYYFYLIDFDLEFDSNYKIYYLKSKNERIRVKLKKLDTVILLILAKLYSTNYMDINRGNGSEVRLPLDMIMDELYKTKIFQKVFSRNEILNSLKTLKKYRIINIKSSNVDENDVIIILPTILYVVTDHNLSDIEVKLQSLGDEKANEEGVNDNETYED